MSPAFADEYICRIVPSDATLTLAIVVGGLVVVAAFIWFARRLIPAALPYFPKEQLLSKGEMAFYRVLVQAVPKQFALSMKTRLSDVIGCTAAGWKAGFGAKISQKHVDFVLFDPVTTDIVLVIELDDKTHQMRDRQDRDIFVDRALAAAGVAILRVPAARDYSRDDLRRQLSDLLRQAAVY